VNEKVQLVDQALRSSQRTVVALPTMTMSPLSCALSSATLDATAPLRISEFSRSALVRVSETTYFLIELSTSPKGWSACSGQ